VKYFPLKGDFKNMTAKKLRERTHIRIAKMGLRKSGIQKELAKRISKPESAVSMALSGYRDDLRKNTNTEVLRKINEALDRWCDSTPSLA